MNYVKLEYADTASVTYPRRLRETNTISKCGGENKAIKMKLVSKESSVHD